jgi:acyl carrier protein
MVKPKKREVSRRYEEKNMSDIADRVKKIVVEHLDAEEDKVTEAASFIDDLGADSLDTIQSFGDAVKFITEAS